MQLHLFLRLFSGQWLYKNVNSAVLHKIITKKGLRQTWNIWKYFWTCFLNISKIWLFIPSIHIHTSYQSWCFEIWIMKIKSILFRIFLRNTHKYFVSNAIIPYWDSLRKSEQTENVNISHETYYSGLFSKYALVCFPRLHLGVWMFL